MRAIDAPIGVAAEVLRADQDVDAAYRRLIEVLASTSVPPQLRTKASPLFIYDQTQLQASLRAQLRGLGWTHGRALSEDVTFDGLRVRGIQADMLGDGLHVILEFGNRASWAHNLVTRALGASVRGFARLTVFVTPTEAFSRRIDSNLGTFERVAASFHLIERWSPNAIPGPLMLVGVEPDQMTPE